MAEVPLPLVQAGEGHRSQDADVPGLKMVPGVLQRRQMSVLRPFFSKMI
jgi:hypothetical protein